MFKQTLAISVAVTIGVIVIGCDTNRNTITNDTIASVSKTAMGDCVVITASRDTIKANGLRDNNGTPANLCSINKGDIGRRIVVYGGAK